MPPEQHNGRLTAEQLADRSGADGFIGASEIAAVAGVSRWSKPIDVWLDKTGRADPEPSNPRAAIGLRLEPVLTGWYAEDTNTDPAWLISPGSLRHPEHNWIGCTPDLLVQPPGRPPQRAAQIKGVGLRPAMFWAEEDVPEDVTCQVAWELCVLHALYGIEWNDVVALVATTDFRILPVQRDPDLEAMLIDAGRDFWRHVTEDTPPPVDGSETWRSYLKRKFPKVERAELLPAPDAADHWAHQHLQAQTDEGGAKAKKAEAHNQLISLIGDAEGFITREWVATYRADKNGRRTLRVKERNQ